MTEQAQQEPTIRVRGMNLSTNSIITRQAAKIEILEVELEQATEALGRVQQEAQTTITRLEQQLLEATTGQQDAPAPELAVAAGNGATKRQRRRTAT